MVFGDGHFVIVYDHDKVRRVFARIVETFERFAAAERTVADDGDDVALFALDVAGSCKPECKAHGSRSVANHEMVVFAFARFGVAGNAPVLFRIQERFGAACQNLVGVALVAYIVDNLVLGRFEYIMQCDGRINESEVRSQMTTAF